MYLMYICNKATFLYARGYERFFLPQDCSYYVLGSGPKPLCDIRFLRIDPYEYDPGYFYDNNFIIY